MDTAEHAGRPGEDAGPAGQSSGGSGSAVAERKAKLEAYVAKSQRTRMHVVVGAAAGAVVGLIVAFAIHRIVGAVITTTCVAFGLCGAWITTAHVWTFRGNLKDLAAGKLEPQVIHVKQGRGRYQKE